MLRSLLRLLYTTVYLSFRTNATTDIEYGSDVYEQTYNVGDDDAKCKITVSEIVFIINYNLFFMPKIKRKLYKADLVYSKNGVIERTFTGHYPKLNIGRGIDPNYSFIIIASLHLDLFFTSELKT